jgi:hypothetical protein
VRRGTIPQVTSKPAAAQHLRDLARLRRVRDRIDREYEQPLDVEALARGVNMSAGHPWPPPTSTAPLRGCRPAALRSSRSRLSSRTAFVTAPSAIPRATCFGSRSCAELRRMKRTLALALAAGIACIGCRSAGLSSANVNTAEQRCDEAYSEDLPRGRVANNAWNKQLAGSYSWEQCIRVRNDSHSTEYGWSWDWPIGGDTLVSFPQIVFGWKPWDGGASSHPRLPMRIAVIHRLNLSYEMETTAKGKHNLATTLWLTRSGAISTEPNPMDISTDLMVWTDGFAFDPFGSRVGHTSIDGIDFEVWLARDLGDSSPDGPRWNYVAYRSTAKHLTASLDLRAFLRHAIEQGYVSPDHYVSDVEVGNEIMTGSGETWIKAISLVVE